MKTTHRLLVEFMVALRLINNDFPLRTVIFIGQDPDGGNERIELHAFGASPGNRRDLETVAIDILLGVEDGFPGLATIAFVHLAEMSGEVEASVRARAARAARS